MLQDHAREQIGLIERALAKAGRKQRPVPLTYLLWGLVGTAFNMAYIPIPWIAARQAELFMLGDVLTVLGIMTTALEYWNATRDRRTALDLQGLAIFGVVTNVLWLLKFPLLSAGVVNGIAYAFIWSIGIAIALVVHGSGPLRPLMYGGCFLLGCVVFAALHPAYMSIAFTLGNYGALVVPGMWMLVVPERR